MQKWHLQVAPFLELLSGISSGVISSISLLAIPGPVAPWKCTSASCGVEKVLASTFATLVQQAFPKMVKA